MKQKGFAPIIILILILGVGIMVASYFVGSKGIFNKLPISFNSPTPAASTDITANWKTYTKAGQFSFKYPSDFKVEERAPDFLVITSPTEHVAQGGISIEARQQNPYDSYSNAINYINSSFKINNNGNVGSWETFNVSGKEGMLEGIDFRMAIIRYKNGVIEAGTIDNQATAAYTAIFDQILSTFKFIETGTGQ